jgi:hypothetical protein
MPLAEEGAFMDCLISGMSSFRHNIDYTFSALVYSATTLSMLRYLTLAILYKIQQSSYVLVLQVISLSI